LLPLRRVIPGLFGLDLASLALALSAQFATVFASCLLVGLFNPLLALLWSLLGLVSMAVYIYFACMIIMIVLSWVAPYTRHPFAVLAVQLVAPLCAPFRRFIPPMGGLDITPVFIFLALQVARILLDNAAVALGAAGQAGMLVPGLF
jgi:YggT family protein